jgi:hypothetical protein
MFFINFHKPYTSTLPTLPTLQALDGILIETTGMADPGPVCKTFNLDPVVNKCPPKNVTLWLTIGLNRLETTLVYGRYINDISLSIAHRVYTLW